jgi:hypothetical protein
MRTCGIHPALEETGITFCYEPEKRSAIMPCKNPDVPSVDTTRGFLEVQYLVQKSDHDGYCSDVDSPSQLEHTSWRAKAWFALTPASDLASLIEPSTFEKSFGAAVGSHDNVCGCRGTSFTPTSARVVAWSVLHLFMDYPSVEVADAADAADV